MRKGVSLIVLAITIITAIILSLPIIINIILNTSIIEIIEEAK